MSSLPTAVVECILTSPAQVFDFICADPAQVLADLRAETERAVPVGARMLVPPEQGAFMAFLVQVGRCL